MQFYPLLKIFEFKKGQNGPKILFRHFNQKSFPMYYVLTKTNDFVGFQTIFVTFVYDVIDDVIAIVLGPENGGKVPLLIEHEGDMV